MIGFSDESTPTPFVILAKGEGAQDVGEIAVSGNQDDAVRGLVVDHELEDLHEDGEVGRVRLPSHVVKENS